MTPFRHRLSHSLPSPQRRASRPRASKARIHPPARALWARVPAAARSALALIVLVAVWAIAAAPAHAGSVSRALSGIVVNGTHGGMAVANQSVTLQATGGSGTHDIATSTTDGQGRFTFQDVASTASGVFAVYVRFQGGLFSSGAIQPESDAAQGIVVTVYDATASDAAVRVTTATVLVRAPHTKNGLIPIGEFFTFHNAGKTAFVGSLAPTDGKPMGLLRFALPPGATNLTLGKGFAGAQAAQVPSGFGANATIPPGDWEFAFAFDAPYTDSRFSLPLKAEYQTDSIILLVAPGMTVTAPDFADKGPKTFAGDQYQMFVHNALAAGVDLRVGLGDLPAAGEPPTFAFGALIGLGGALALLLAMLVALYLRRGDLAVALRLAPATTRGSDARRAAPLTADERSAEHTRLLHALLRLERDRAAGRLTAAQYRTKAGQTRSALRALLAASPEDTSRPRPADADSGSTPNSHSEARAPAARVPSRATSGGGQ